MPVERKFRLLTKNGTVRYYSSFQARDANAQRIADESGELTSVEFLVDSTWVRVRMVKPNDGE